MIAKLCQSETTTQGTFQVLGVRALPNPSPLPADQEPTDMYWELELSDQAHRIRILVPPEIFLDPLPTPGDLIHAHIHALAIVDAPPLLTLKEAPRITHHRAPITHIPPEYGVHPPTPPPSPPPLSPQARKEESAVEDCPFIL